MMYVFLKLIFSEVPRPNLDPVPLVLMVENNLLVVKTSMPTHSIKGTIPNSLLKSIN